VVSRRSIARFGGGYGLSVIVGGVLSVAVIPVVIIVAGTTAWATIAVAQAVAGFGYVLVAAGWGVTGPTDVASRTPERRGQFYMDSLATRGWLFLLVLVPAAVIAILLTGHDAALAAVTVASGLLAGLSGGWFFVGEGSPIRFLLIETLPRNVGTVLGALALILTQNPLWYVVLQGVAALASTVLTSTNVLRRYPGWVSDLSFVRGMRRLKEHASAISMSATSTIYVNLPIVIVQVFLPQATAVYALAERMMRLALYSTRPLVQVSQGYVPHPDIAEQTVRGRRVFVITTMLSVAGGLLYAAFGPLAGDLLSGSALGLPFSVSIPMGTALAAILLSQVTGFTLLNSFGLTRSLAISTIAGAIVGAAFLIPGAILFDLPGLAWALAASEVAVLIVQLFMLRPHLFSGPQVTRSQRG
jgi:O-antigen/teichoic acid export membrane protein